MQELLSITFIGHATCLLQCGPLAVLTDVHLGHQLGWMTRATDCDTLAAALPELSAVVISHTHADHLHLSSFKYIRSRVPVIVPPHSAGLIHPFVNNPIVELAQWVPHTPAPGVTITPVPVRHFGGRWIPGLRYRHVHGYLISLAGWTIYFAGDTSYGTHFREVGNMANIDVALLPLGGFRPHVQWLQRPMHALELVQAFLDLKAQHLVPIHWGAFGNRRTAEAQLTHLTALATERELSPRLHIIAPGSAHSFESAVAEQAAATTVSVIPA